MKATIPYNIIIFLWIFILPNIQAQENPKGISSSLFVSQIPHFDDAISSVYLQMAYYSVDERFTKFKLANNEHGKKDSQSWAEFIVKERISEFEGFYLGSRDEKVMNLQIEKKISEIDTIVQLNLIKVFGDYIALAGISIDNEWFYEELDIEKRQHSSLKSDVFLAGDFEYKFVRPNIDLYSAYDRIIGGYNYFGFVHTCMLNAISINTYGITSAMELGVVGRGNRIEVVGNLNNVTVMQQ